MNPNFGAIQTAAENRDGRRIWRAVAPSNIALIKYMGKIEGAGNRPTNSSLSYALPHLRSMVELEFAAGGTDTWEALTSFENRRMSTLQLSDSGARRFLAHFENIKKQQGCGDSGFIVRSANDFPSDCGLASSASSFAALTAAAIRATAELGAKPQVSLAEAAVLSRQGSGSSCRSFFSPWALWDAQGARAVSDLGYADLVHQVVVVDQGVKGVSSSEAHKRVSTSRLFQGRPERAEARAREIVDAFHTHDWRSAAEIAWAEFWDMHALFETSSPSFGYMTPASLKVLDFTRALWRKLGDGPIVTMDAGPNVHLLFRNDDLGHAAAVDVEKTFAGRFRIFSSHDLGRRA